MTKQTEALKMAHKSFMQLNERHPRKDNGEGYFDAEIKACKDALEQPAQEPVAWIIQTQKIDGEPTEPYAMMGKYKYVADTCDFGEPIPLYTHPAPAWQGLSDDEINSFYGKSTYEGLNGFARAIEQALKEKNT